MSTKKKVVENSFLYIFSSLLVKAIGFLMLPIYTLFLSPKDYGITNLANSFINVATYLITFSLYSAVLRFYSEFKNDNEKLKRFHGSIITFTFITGSIFISIGVIFNQEFVNLFFEGIDFFPIVMISFINLLFISLNRIHQNILQAIQKGKKLTIINIVVFLAIVVLNVIFIAIFKLGPLGILLSQTIIYIIYLFYMIQDLYKNDLIILGIDWKILKEALTYSIPLMPHNLSTQIAAFTSRIFINKSSTLAIVGLYGIGMQFAQLIDLIQISVNKAFQPWLFLMLKKNDQTSQQEVVELSNTLLTFYSLVYMLIGLFSQEVVILMTSKDYLMAWTVIPILVVSFSVKSIYYFYVNLAMYYIEATRKLFIATTIGSFTDIILAYFFVKYYGMYGAAASFLVAKIIVVSIVIYIVQPYNIIGYKIASMIKIILPSIFFMSIGLIFSYTKFETVFNLWNFFYKVLILIVYIAYIIYVNRYILRKYIQTGKFKELLRRKK